MNKLLRAKHTAHIQCVQKAKTPFEVVFPFLWASAIWWLFLVIKQMILGTHKNQLTARFASHQSRLGRQENAGASVG